MRLNQVPEDRDAMHVTDQNSKFIKLEDVLPHTRKIGINYVLILLLSISLKILLVLEPFD